MIQYTYSCMSGILSITIIFFMLSLVFILFSLYYYFRYARIKGTYKGEDCSPIPTPKPDYSPSLDFKYKYISVDATNDKTGELLSLCIKADKKDEFKEKQEVVLIYDSSITDLSKLNSSNTFLDKNWFSILSFIIGIILLLLSFLSFIITFPPNDFAYTTINCSKYLS
jgi:hypothetical protein